MASMQPVYASLPGATEITAAGWVYDSVRPHALSDGARYDSLQRSQCLAPHALAVK